MFSLNGFALKTVKGMIGNYPNFQAMEYALDWYGKGVLTESNLAEIESMIEIKNTPDEVIDLGTEGVNEPAGDIGEPVSEVINPQEMVEEPLT